VQADVDTQGDFVRTLAAEVRDSSFANIDDVVAFVAWLDEELSFLVSTNSLVTLNSTVFIALNFGWNTDEMLVVANHPSSGRRACGPEALRLAGETSGCATGRGSQVPGAPAAGEADVVVFR
jgi:hypothetical protein